MIDVKNERDITFTGRMFVYPDGSLDVQCASRALFRESGWEPVDDRVARDVNPREIGKKSEGEDMLRSMRRARAKLRRLALANDFEYFVTLTLDGAKIDRYDATAVVRKLNQWTDNMVRRHDLRYILVPELHKDGAFHFHGFLAGNGISVQDSGIQWNGRTVFNLPQWKLGFSAAQRLYGDYHAAVGYCCKYIGKQDGQRILGRWYYSGGNLRQPEVVYVDLDWRDFEGDWEVQIPNCKILGKFIGKDV